MDCRVDPVDSVALQVSGDHFFARVMRRARWSHEERVRFAELAGQKTVAELTRLFGRSDLQINRALYEMGIRARPKHEPLTPEEQLHLERVLGKNTATSKKKERNDSQRKGATIPKRKWSAQELEIFKTMWPSPEMSIADISLRMGVSLEQCCEEGERLFSLPNAPWSPDEKKELTRRWNEGEDRNEIARSLRRSAVACVHHVKKLLREGKLWSEEETALFKELWDSPLKITEIAARMGVSPEQCCAEGERIFAQLKTRWSSRDKDKLIQLFHRDEDRNEIARSLKRTHAACSFQINKFLKEARGWSPEETEKFKELWHSSARITDIAERMETPVEKCCAEGERLFARSKTSWSPRDKTTLLRLLNEGEDPNEIARALKRSPDACAFQATALSEKTHWSEEETALFKELWHSPAKIEEVAERMRCSAARCCAEAEAAMYQDRRPWTDEESALLLEGWHQGNREELARFLGRTQRACFKHVHRLGLMTIAAPFVVKRERTVEEEDDPILLAAPSPINIPCSPLL